MTKTSRERKIWFARNIDETALRRIVDAVSNFPGADTSIRVSFSNGFEVNCDTVDELLGLPMTASERVETLSIRSRENTGAALAEKRSATEASVRISYMWRIPEVGYSVSGELPTCLTLSANLDSVFKSTLSPLRSIWHVHVALDLLLAAVIIPVAMKAFILPAFGINLSPNDTFSIQMVCAAAYFLVKFFAFPRVVLTWGKGLRVEARRILVLKFLGAFLILGAAQAIYQQWVIDKANLR
ncbi:hypothetical protein H009_02423 [Agrobacterium tumefaciens str. Cherry 2E-2-2]|nr:hypothetical protein H009_02423 [Agrobacterium tumefaciens str. Cherry 2E-2-2]